MNKKTLYTSIMKDVSRIIKHHLNEEYYAEDIDMATKGSIYKIIIDAVKNDELLIVGEAYDTPCISISDVYDYLEDKGVIGEDDDIDDMLYDMRRPVMIYDTDVLYQMENGLDGLEEGSAVVFDEPMTYSEYNY